MTYYKKDTQHTRFNEENGEMIHIFKTNLGDLSLNIVNITQDQKQNAISSLQNYAETSTESDFNILLEELKSKVSSL